MARVDACARIFAADKPEKIAQIMQDRQVDELTAGRIYTLGALKASIRRGTARTYAEALEHLEYEQVGDRGDPLTRTLSAERVAANIAEYRCRTEAEPMRVTHVDVVRRAWARMDNQPISTYAQDWHYMDDIPDDTGRHGRTMRVGRILGAMYADWEAREIEADPVYGAHNAMIDRNLRVFFADYVRRLSRTVRRRIDELVEYIEATGADKVEERVKSLTTARAQKAPETSKLARFADNLHRQFSHKDSVSCPEFIELLHRYCRF
jgi:hypothetical protein